MLAGNGCICGCGVRNIYALAVYNSTITGNHTNPGSGAGLFSDGDAATATLANTVIAGNTAGFSNPDCNASVTSLDYNFIGNASGCTLTGGGHDLLGGAALLGPLQNNGGPTQTVAYCRAVRQLTVLIPRAVPVPRARSSEPTSAAHRAPAGLIRAATSALTKCNSRSLSVAKRYSCGGAFGAAGSASRRSGANSFRVRRLITVTTTAM